MKSIYVSTLALLCVLPSLAESQEIPSIVAGMEPATPNGVFQNVAIPFKFKMLGTLHRSYRCTAIADNTDARFTSVTGFNPAVTDSAFRGDSSPSIQSLTNPVGPETGGRLCFFADARTPYEFTVDQVPLDDPKASFDNLRVSCEETTLFGGYNTSTSELNFLELTNTTGQDVRVRIRGFAETSGGESVLDISLTLERPTSFRVTRKDLDIHSLVGPGSFGPIVITHDAPSGVVTARLSQYDVISTNPLDFRLVGQTDFKTQSSAR